MRTKMTMFIGLGMFALIMLGTVPISAGPQIDGGDGRAKDRDGAQGGILKRSAARVDRDGDGNISMREFYAFASGRLDNDTVKRIFKAADKNGDGVLSYREFAYAMLLMIRSRGNGIGRFPDTDRDGNVSMREFYAFINGRLGNDTVKRIFKAADKDGNGQLSRREFVLALNFMLRMRANQGNASPDRDGDGYVSLREFYAFINGRLDNDTVKRIFKAADRDGDGRLSVRELVQATKMARKACGSTDGPGSERERDDGRRKGMGDRGKGGSGDGASKRRGTV